MGNKVDRDRWQEQMQAIGIRGKLPEALTEAVLEAARARPRSAEYTLADGKVPGLSLLVGASGASTFWLHYRTHAGVRRRLKIGVAGAVTLKSARDLAREALASVGRGGDPVSDRMAARAASETVRAYLRDVYGPKVLAHRKDGGMPRARKAGAEPKPSGTYGRILAAWEPLLDVQLAALTRDAIEKVLADRKEAGLAAGTLLRDWSAFRALMADAVDRGHLLAVPMARRPEPIRKLRGNERVRYLGQHDEKEPERFFRALEAFESEEPGGGDFLRTIVRLALNTGCRRGELVRLTDKMVNLRDRRIALPAEITKTSKARTVYLNDAALAALKAWKLRGPGGALFLFPDADGTVAPERAEDRLTQREWPRLCEQAAVSDLHLHDCRHDYAVRLLRSCGSLTKVRDALGHSSVSQTEKYAHVAATEVREAVLGLGARVS